MAAFRRNTHIKLRRESDRQGQRLGDQYHPRCSVQLLGEYSRHTDAVCSAILQVIGHKLWAILVMCSLANRAYSVDRTKF